LTHAGAAAAIGTAILPRAAGSRVWSLGIACAILPDLDVAAFAFGIPYPVTPIQVSPIGAAFFSERGLRVLASEVCWVCLPAALLAAASLALQGASRPRE
jgi:hypothetical protein